MADDPSISRRTVPVPGGSCNLRLGHKALSALGSGLTAVIGKPRNAVVIAEPGLDEGILTEVRHQLSDAGFLAVVHTLVEDAPIRTLGQAEGVFRALSAHGITTDDVIVAAGGVDTLSLALFCAASWRGGVVIALVPTDCTAALECVLTAPGLDLEGDASAVGAIAPSAYPRLIVCDLDHLDALDGEAGNHARAMMAQTAMSDSKNSFSQLAERAEAIASGDIDAMGDQMLDTMRSRGRIACSNAVALRRSLEYGVPFARALMRLAPEVDAGTALAEGLRFASRLSAGEGSCDVELVLTQDALLARLALPEARVDIDPSEFTRAIREECFRKTNRFMLALPQDFGKVRLASVDEELLEEHLGAWCMARRG
ncbi:MAG: 3-dehydroquinate synthase [Atopobiaceae bacterium]|nr:3-dehydroquinate synthase [Atopobiaceae bacterium]